MNQLMPELDQAIKTLEWLSTKIKAGETLYARQEEPLCIEGKPLEQVPHVSCEEFLSPDINMRFQRSSAEDMYRREMFEEGSVSNANVMFETIHLDSEWFELVVMGRLIDHAFFELFI